MLLPDAPILIRQAQERDLDAIRAIEVISHAGPWTRDNFASELRSAISRFVVATDAAEKLVGYYVAWLVSGESQMQNITVAPAARRQGVGAALMRDWLSWCEANACQRCELEVHAGNGAALALYEQFGFATVGKRPRYYSDGGDAVLMERVLRPLEASPRR